MTEHTATPDRTVGVDLATADALIAALVARSAALGRTLPPRTEEQLRLAPVEGWLHLPGPLDDLAPPARPGLSGSLA
ncbi:hypothetical protein ACWCYY_26470 [Kitasatospora sp. NPDC001664]